MAIVAALCCLPRSAAADIFFYRDRSGVLHFTNAPTDSRFRVLIPEKRRLTIARARSSGRRLPPEARSTAPAEIRELIQEAAQRYEVDPALVHAVVRAESAFDHLAVSPAGARGLMQLMPGTASDVGVRNVFQPRENLDGGVYYLRSMMDRYNGDVRLALAAYNAGPGAVDNYGGIPPYSETIDYVQRVLRYRQDYARSRLASNRLALNTSARR